MRNRQKTGREWKRGFSVLLAFVMAFSIQMPLKVRAAENTGTLGTNGNITWSYDTGTKTLTVSGEDELKGGYDEDKYCYYSSFTTLCGEKEVDRIVFEDCKLTGSAESLFAGLKEVKEIDLSGLDTGNVTDMKYMFDGCSGLRGLDVSGFDTGNVTSMWHMFYNCSGLSSLDVSGFDTKNVTGMWYMFYNCSGLRSLDVSGFDTKNVTDMGYMFSGCSGLESLDVSGFDTKNVTDMENMFFACRGLTSLDVSGLNTGNVTNMMQMFYDCSGLRSLDVSGFDTGNVTDMRWMFYDCRGLRSLDVSGFDTGNVMHMGKMFSWCRGLGSLDVSGFDTGNVMDMGSMFSGCSGLESLDVSSFEISSGTNTAGMLSGCTPAGLKAPKVIKKEIPLDVSYQDKEGNIYTALKAENAGKELKRPDVSYRITYILNGGENHGENPAEGNSVAAVVLQAPSRTGYAFAGWYRNMEGTDTKVTEIPAGNREDVILTARWTANSYTVAFDGNGATGGSMEPMTGCAYGREYTLPASGFSKTGYTFTGWNTKADGSGTAYADKASVKNLSAQSGETVILYAQWETNTYAIKFHKNGADGGSMASMTACCYDRSYTLPDNKFTRTGYTFTGWNTKKDGSGKSYKNKASVKDLTSKDGATVTLYAQWKKKSSTVTYRIKFNGNGATGGKMSALTKCKSGKSYKLPANQFKKKGYTFAGWNTKKNGSGKSYKNKASVKNLTTKNGATVTLYAQWKPVTYTVKFDGNKASSGKMKDIKNCKYDKKFRLPKSVFRRKGYTFKGWNTKKDGSGRAYKNLEEVKNLTDKNGKTVVLYAQWKKAKK